MVLYFLLLLVVLILGITLYSFNLVFYSPVRNQCDPHNIPKGSQYRPYHETMLRMIDQLDSISYEEVSIQSYDGLKLTGRYYHVKDGAPLAICCHGYRSIPVRDFSGGAVHCMELGQNVLLINQRGQGFSQGHCITFGILEQQDCISWIRYANSRFGGAQNIYLYGISMGATTVLLASGHDLPGNVKGIIADCPYSSASEIIKKVCVDRKYPPSLVFPFISLAAKLFGRFSLSDGKVRPALQKATVPILLIHGTADRFVPFEMSQKLAVEFPDKIQFEPFPDAAHGISFLADRDRYLSVVDEFIRNNT